MRCRKAPSAILLVLFLLACRPADRLVTVEHRLAPKPGTAVAARMKTGEVHAWQIHMKAGWFADVTVFQKGVDLAVRLGNPDGLLIATVDSPNGAHGPELGWSTSPPTASWIRPPGAVAAPTFRRRSPQP
jgi:hypothetical protein